MALKRATEERNILINGRRVLCQPPRVKYLFVNQNLNEFSVISDYCAWKY